MSFWSDKNVGRIERWASGIGGGLLVAAGIRRRSLPAVALATVGGGWLLLRSVTGHCPVYRALGIDRRLRRSSRSEKARRRSLERGATGADVRAFEPPEAVRPAPYHRVMETHQPLDVVQEASEESFPASDAPAWTTTGGLRG